MGRGRKSNPKPLEVQEYGRTPKEMAHDNAILAQQFYTEELALITNLGHFIATEAEN